MCSSDLSLTSARPFNWGQGDAEAPSRSRVCVVWPAAGIVPCVLDYVCSWYWTMCVPGTVPCVLGPVCSWYCTMCIVPSVFLSTATVPELASLSPVPFVHCVDFLHLALNDIRSSWGLNFGIEKKRKKKYCICFYVFKFCVYIHFVLIFFKIYMNIYILGRR